ncbi:MAG: response regulator [Gammaproteobacteria bacterium]
MFGKFAESWRLPAGSTGVGVRAKERHSFDIGPANYKEARNMVPEAARIRVLVAEDNDDIATLLEMLLSGEEGLEWVGCVDEAAKVLAAVDRVAADVLLLDLELKGFSSIEVLRECQRSFPDLTVIILTGHSQPTVRQAALAAGAADFLVKPDDLEKLGARIRAAR